MIIFFIEGWINIIVEINYNFTLNKRRVEIIGKHKMDSRIVFADNQHAQQANTRNKGTSLHPKMSKYQHPLGRNLAPQSKFAPIKVQSG